MSTVCKIKLPSGKIRYKGVVMKDGKRMTKNFGRKSLARNWADRMEHDKEVMESLGAGNHKITFKELALNFLEKSSGKDVSLVQRVNYWVNVFANKTVVSIKKEHIRVELEKLAKSPVMRNGGFNENGERILIASDKIKSASTVNRYKMALSALMKFAISMSVISNNPCAGIASNKESRGRERFLTESERDSLLLACKDSSWDKLHMIVTMALFTGARRGELLKLTWENIDIKNRTATLLDTKDNGTTRVISLTVSVVKELMQHRKASGLIFDDIAERSVTHHFHKALEVAEINDFKFHDLRHSAASYLINEGVSLYKVAKILGHKALSTTQRYAHLDIKKLHVESDAVFNKISK